MYFFPSYEYQTLEILLNRNFMKHFLWFLRVPIVYSLGISYLSRVQESAAKVRIGNPTAITYQMNSSSTPTVADAVFVERIKSRIKNWKNSCKSSNSRTDGKKNAVLDAS